MHDYAPGDTIGGRYRVVRPLGRGAYGVTLECVDQAADEGAASVAVKILALDAVDHWDAVRRFEREAAVLESLDHPGIPAYVDFIAPATDADTDGAPARPVGSRWILVQALAPGRTLGARLAAGWRPDEAAVTAIAEQLLDILAYLHALSPPVVHRDVKPSNILMDDDGRVSLVDFGAVRDTLTAGSTTASIAGTFGYMAPEQFQGRVQPASDLYGLGATLVHLLARRPPSDLPHRRLTLDHRAAVQTTPAFASFLDALLRPAWEDRPASAVEARALLRDADPALVPVADRPRVRSRSVDDGVELTIRGRATGLGWLLAGVPLLALGALVLLGAVTGKVGHPLTLRAFSVVAGVVVGYMGLQVARAPLHALLTRAHLRLCGDSWELRRTLLGVDVRTVSGHRDALEWVEPDAEVGRFLPLHGAALRTADDYHLLGVGLDTDDHAQIAGAVSRWRRSPA